MGRSIFNLFSDAPVAVTVLGRDPVEMDRQGQRIEKRLRRAVGAGLLAEADLARRLADLRFTTSGEALGECDLVVETISENFDAKIEVLQQAEGVISPQAVLTSNTSSLSLTRLAEHLRDPTRFCGFHFFHPVQLMTIVEIITTPRTSPATVDLLRQVSRDIGRAPLVVKDLAGSCLNVPLVFFCCEALYILEQGFATPSRIDAVAGQIARVGPCETVDAIGLPLCLAILRAALEAFGGDQQVPELCERLLRDGRFGKYAKQGIYIYREDRPTDDACEYYLNAAQVHSHSGARSDAAGLLERLVSSIYFCVLKLAQEGLGDLGDLCVGMNAVLGLKVDVMEEMRKLGSRGLRDMFERLQGELGDRFDCRPLEGIMATLDDR